MTRSEPSGEALGPPPDAARIERWALHYLERYAASAARLRLVLERRLRRLGFDPADAADPLDAVVARMIRLGLVDDRRYAEMKVASLSRRGASTRGIRARLGAAGVGTADVDAALASRGTSAEQAERAAAVALARRRRLGPFGDPQARAARRMRDLASMARAGFSAALCRAVIDAPDRDAAEDWAADTD